VGEAVARPEPRRHPIAMGGPAATWRRLPRHGGSHVVPTRVLPCRATPSLTQPLLVLALVNKPVVEERTWWQRFSLPQVFSCSRRLVRQYQLRPSTNSVPRGTVTHPIANPRVPHPCPRVLHPRPHNRGGIRSNSIPHHSSLFA